MNFKGASPFTIESELLIQKASYGHLSLYRQSAANGAGVSHRFFTDNASAVKTLIGEIDFVCDQNSVNSYLSIYTRTNNTVTERLRIGTDGKTTLSELAVTTNAHITGNLTLDGVFTGSVAIANVTGLQTALNGKTSNSGPNGSTMILGSDGHIYYWNGSSMQQLD